MGKVMFDIVGDVHGCGWELFQLLEKLGYIFDNSTGTTLYLPPSGRKLVFVGDLVDRGWNSAVVVFFVKDMVNAGYALLTRGNHDDKLMRWAKGNNVKINHGFDKTIHNFNAMRVEKEELYSFLSSIPMYLSLDGGKLIVSHAAWKSSLRDVDPFNKKCRSWCLYGPTTGKVLEGGLPDRIDWVVDRKEDSPIIVYGHQVYKDPRVLNGTYGIDTGCVFGGYLTSLRYPELKFVNVKALRVYDDSKPEIVNEQEYQKR